MGYLYYLKKDLYRYAGNETIGSFIKYYITSSGFKFTVWLRACHFLRKKKIYKYIIFPFCALIYRHYKFKFGYDIPYSIEIGPGLLLFHINGIIVSAKKIGKNATLSHTTTIGMTIKNGSQGFPIIGDNFYIAPGGKVIGGIIVGNNVIVGTNCVLNFNVPDNSVLVGIPARMVSDKGSGEYVENPIE